MESLLGWLLMAILQVNNLTVLPVFIDDVGIEIPALSFDAISDPDLIRDLATSARLRVLVIAGTLSLSDGTNPVTLRDQRMVAAAARRGTHDSGPESGSFR